MRCGVIMGEMSWSCTGLNMAGDAIIGTCILHNFNSEI
ncbi:hypothetical protein DBT_0596 [Dissulfuribacter thermophilus]|uniref:Uncharacterized protein n=1 Tax=Dissulfuribacter thermophilus TaxID=1156395 RepID=A0A1B9F8F5_9BACT|nr:hypothetical protein DBT_0596 [Dissulfuribacter thermophilus]